jgi:SagB-type dehydrogenase family enzyme
MIFSCGCVKEASMSTPEQTTSNSTVINLPEPRYDSDVSIEQSLLQRRSVRSYSGEPLTLAEISQLLWAAQGITDLVGFRTAPSAGALYPLEIYLAVGNVEDLSPGVFKYRPKRHDLIQVSAEDVREELAEAALGQACIREGSVDIVIAGVYERTMRKYADRGMRYVHMEAGHAAQNIYLQAAALDLGMVTVGAFYDDQVKVITCMLEDETPLYVIPVGGKT